ncbi:MAG TPA: RecX family transcriptional regulator [Candidatus Saccharimonadales bacterium]|jgi:regulatory protein|nr:RecX family transcriptional regulator [Candidatus Saccharimonadales bacterium]
MKITAIKQQQKRADRYSVFVEGKYTFSLSEAALLELKLASGQELSPEQAKEFKKISADDKLYNQTLRWAAMRLRTKWEVETYLERKQASPALIEYILNKLSNIELVNDEKFAKAFVNDRQLLRPTSRRKLILELHKKHVGDELIRKVMEGHEPEDEQAALSSIIERKRRQSRYEDDLKLMQYLARQGFNYDNIKSALGKK